MPADSRSCRSSDLIKDVKCGLIEDGTAVGMGIANAVTRLKDSKAKSKSYHSADGWYEQQKEIFLH